MSSLEIAEVELVIVFLKSLLKKQTNPASLEAQNLEASIRIVDGAFLRKQK